jgi:hypothetical protein
MYRENYINSLRTELVGLVADYLTPVALRYGYSEVPLEANIKWRPQVLVLGNYSSGKSTLINEFLGAQIQATGQAPTDDSFTIITYDDSAPDEDPVRVTEERDGKYLLNDPEYPFETLKKHGQRFAAHFRLKRVNSPFLRGFAIVDTPGMLDSITERDRGYNYQEVIGDLAQLADLVLVVFDAHKAGTVREAYISLRETLPSRTFEDRVVFVLNRIDECASLIDLLRVYGTLCWNLSQITGRKDIPMIRLTYSPHVTANANTDPDSQTDYLPYLDNQREELKNAIFEAPRHRLDHLASFVETHSERIAHLLEGLINYRKRRLGFRFKNVLTGLFVSLLLGAGATLAALTTNVLPPMDQRMLFGAGGAFTLLFFLFWLWMPLRRGTNKFHNDQLTNLDAITSIENQTRRDSWHAVRDLAYNYLKGTHGRFSLREVKREHASVCHVRDKGSREIREALNELASTNDGEPLPTGAPVFSETSAQVDSAS